MTANPPPFQELRDAHLHLAMLGDAMSQTDLSAAHSVGDALHDLTSACKKSPADAWVIARSYRAEGVRERRFPSAEELDAVAGGRHVVVRSFDHHAMAVSSSLLAAAGIDRSTPDPPGGVIERDAHGRPTGLLLEHARLPVYDLMPAPNDEQIAERIRTAAAHLTGLGFVEAHDMMTFPDEAGVMLDLDDAGDLGMRITLYATPESLPDVRDLFDVRTPDGRTSASGNLRFAGLKLFCDGTLNSRTAHMLAPFADPIEAHPCGTPLLSADEIRSHMSAALNRGLDVAAHAIGDAAVRSLLDIYESLGMPRERNGLRIEHAQFVDQADIPRFAQLGVTASLQPCHLLTDIEGINRLLPHRADRAFPIRDLLDAGATVLLGSDAPVVPADPADNVQAAVHRRRAGMPESDAIAPAQAITHDQAVALMRVP